jgi:hypothetical protein|tara:strand:+ start:68 stop:283 length:216 start_codon:yes stop_codon:yes gene_type:complete
MSEVVKFSIPSIIIVVVETDIEDEKRLRFSMKIFPIFFFHDEEQHKEELCSDERREIHAEEEEEMRARPTI